MTDEFEGWLFGEGLGLREQVAVEHKVDLLCLFGPNLGRPHADTLAGTQVPNLKELRAHTANAELRVLFAFDPYRRAVLLLGGSKTGKWDRWYRRAIPEAEALYEKHLKGSGN